MQQDIFNLIRTVEVFSNETMIRFTKSFPHNIGISSILVLEKLREKAPEKPTVIAGLLGYTPGNMTSIANKLIKQGYVKREADEKDRRIQYLNITEAGKNVLIEAQQKGQEIRKELFDVLTEQEVQQFLAIHEKLLHYMRRKME